MKIKKIKLTEKGFTLVELVVVIAIIGVLAAILVPSMLNYVKKSRLKAANANAKIAYNAAAEYITEQETMGYSLNSCFGMTGKFNGGNVHADRASNDGDRRVAEMLLNNGDEAGVFCISKCTLKNGEKTFMAHWKKSNTDEIIGQFPDPVSWENWKANHGSFVIGSYIAPI